jgi:Phytanoyl-CoA dioxygenase (PhyH)
MRERAPVIPGQSGGTVLTAQQLDHFATFGFVVLPGMLGGRRTAALRGEVDAALRDAYAATYDERTIDGISGHYLPMTSRLTPVSAGLVCDDPILIDAAEGLLGGPVLPALPEGVLYFGDAPWHNDDGIGIAGVKFATYFDRLNAANGALRFVPCSQHTEARALASAYQRAPYDDWPGVIAASVPGDVIAFDLHTFHASFGGRDRLAWTIEYLADLPGEAARARVLRSMEDVLEQGSRGFDRDRYPAWRDWAAATPAHPRRAATLERLRRAGVMDLPGAEMGW